MSALGLTLFDTALGPVGIAWSEGGVAGVQLPEASARATRARLLRRFPGASEATRGFASREPPPPALADACERIAALLAGEPRDLTGVALDLAGVEPFARRVYEAARSIPPGRTLSYGELAKRIGAPGEARAVGEALARNPVPLLVPCHRVLAAGGRLGGFSAPGGAATKRRLLALEGAAPGGQPELFG
jgi:methylated-DNA-[protein]-cysteine S-methyltransferase